VVKVVGIRGKFKLLEIKDGNKLKTLIVHPVHLKNYKMGAREETPITMSEVVALAGDSERGEAIKKFIKDFNKMPVEKAKEMKEELKALDLIKLKDLHIVKIVDFIPTDASELNKVIIEVSLSQDEVNKILEVTKKYK